MCLELLNILPSFLTLFVAVIVAVIACLQWKTNSNRLKHELFDRRYEQFTVVRDFISSIIVSGKSTSEEQQKYISGTRGMMFIFDKNLVKYTDEHIWYLATELECLDSEIQDLPVGDERSKNAKRQGEIKKQLYHELKSVEKQFSKYLHLTH